MRLVGPETVEERFWQKVRVEDGCWEWTASRHYKGYGWFRVGDRMEKAHRVSYLLHHGPIPEGMSVLHKCDNPACVRPDHIFLGTQQENIADMVRKGRVSRGPGSTLTDADVLAIRASGKSNTELARLYGQDQSTISRVRNRRTRRYL